MTTKQRKPSGGTKQTKGPVSGGSTMGDIASGITKARGQAKKKAPHRVTHAASSLGGQNQNYRGSGMGMGRSKGIATRRRQGTK